MGIPRLTKEVVVTAEGSWLLKGSAYLIDASEGDDKQLYPNICGASGETTSEYTAPVLDFLRQRAKGKAKTSLTVYVSDQHQPLSDFEVKINGPNGTLKGRTGADGLARFDDIKPGSYHATVARVHYRADTESSSIPDLAVLAGSCPSAQIAVKPDPVVAGVVLHTSGVPVPGLPLELISAPEGPIEKISLNRPFFLTKTDAQGHFDFESVSPGRYLLGTNIIGQATSPTPPAFYPGSRTRDAAASIEVRLGEPVDKLLFTLPDFGRLREIRVCVVDQDGKATPGVDIASGLPLQNGAKLVGELTTDETGCVRAHGYTIATYLIHAILQPPGTDFLQLRLSDETIIEPGEDPVRKVLVLKPPLRPAR